ncbi:MAG: hypothetical protein DHS20C16_24200 [Phycisphaerae bacterium]|nr:MAG: hypothetical protein DHS20C16_24200 [Phycisphaerae bacterium]
MALAIENPVLIALGSVAAHGAAEATAALSKWFNRGVRVTSDGFEAVPLESLNAAIGDPEKLVVAVRMPIDGEITGDILLTMPDDVAMTLCDLLMQQPPGTTTSIGEMELSCVQETGNIVGSAMMNGLVEWLNVTAAPGPPTVLHDMVCATVEPILVQQASESDEVLLARSDFLMDKLWLEWGLYLLPSPESSRLIARRCADDRVERFESVINSVAASGAMNASQALSKWFNAGVRLRTDEFVEVPLDDLESILGNPEEPVAALRMPVTGGFEAESLLAFSEPVALSLIDLLMGQELGTSKELDEAGRSCLQETANIVSSSYVNSMCDWLGVSATPQSPHYQYDLAAAVIAPVLLEQAQVSDTVLFTRTDFLMDGHWLDWIFLLVPSPKAMDRIREMCE